MDELPEICDDAIYALEDVDEEDCTPAICKKIAAVIDALKDLRAAAEEASIA